MFDHNPYQHIEDRLERASEQAERDHLMERQVIALERIAVSLEILASCVTSLRNGDKIFNIWENYRSRTTE